MLKNRSSRLVFSTETGRLCPACGHAVAACTCGTTAKAAVLADGAVRVMLQTKGRGGKSVTVVKGLALDAPALSAVGKQLRAACGAGGTLKDGVLEVQGAHVELVLAWLHAQGYRAKKAG